MLNLVGQPIDISNQTCTIQSPQQISLPSDYRSYTTFGAGPALNETDTKASSFDWYDAHVEQSIPWIISGYMKPFTNSDEVRNDSQVVCVAPNVVVEGSRQPKLQLPHNQNNQSSPNDPGTNGGSGSESDGVAWRSAWKVTVLVAGATGLLLTYL